MWDPEKTPLLAPVCISQYLAAQAGRRHAACNPVPHELVCKQVRAALGCKRRKQVRGANKFVTKFKIRLDTYRHMRLHALEQQVHTTLLELRYGYF